MATFKKLSALDVALAHCTLTAQGSKSWRGMCPDCGHPDGMVISKERFYLTCCDDTRGGDGNDLLKVLFPDDPIRRSAPTPAPLPEPAPEPFDAVHWHKTICGTQKNLTPDSAGGAYLLGRGLQLATWAAFRLGEGYRGKPADHALLIPWFAGGHLIGGRYRLLNPPDKHLRYAWWKNSTTGKLYASHTHAQRATLIVCEGEINAMSIWQAAGERVDVLSTGSENVPVPTKTAWAGRWQQVVCWFDKWERAQAWATALGGVPVSLPETDANDLLQASELKEFLQESAR